jgi:predicted ATP-grasp superfamily ATP-dependent carboligase
MAKDSIIYITKDRERAEALPESDAYSIVSGDSTKDTLTLLTEVDIPKGSTILVFKNTKQIEEVAAQKGLKLLNPSAELAERIENKVTQVGWLDELAPMLPPHHITLVKKITKGTSGILQWAHSHTGGGTIHLTKESDVKNLQEKFPEREARISTYIKGPMFTANVVVSPEKILVGNISYQITGLPPFTENQFSTIGNDWSVPPTILTESKLQEFQEMAEKVGLKLQKEGWKGLFGVDIVYDEERDKLFLIEINARQPASTTYESQLQAKAREHGVPGITTFEAHIAALTGKPMAMPLIEINDGAQIVQRVTSSNKKIDISSIENAGYKVITYKNTKPNADLIRIQSERGIMETHNKFNTRGKEIEGFLK